MKNFLSLTTLICFFTLLSCEKHEFLQDQNSSSVNLNGPSGPGGSSPCPPGSVEVNVLQNWNPGSPYGTTCPGQTLEIEATGYSGPISWTIYGATVIGYYGVNNKGVIVETPSINNIVQLSFKATDSCGRNDTILGRTDPYDTNCQSYCENYPNSSLCQNGGGPIEDPK